MVSPVLLIAVPLGLAFAVPLLRLISRRIPKYIPPVAMLFNLVLSVSLMSSTLKGATVVSIGGWDPPFCINLVVDSLSILFSVLIALVGFLVSIYALDYIEMGATENTEKYHMLYLLLLVGATGVVLTGDIFNLFVFFEILCISSYALVAYLGDKAGVESGIKYLIQGAIGSSLILIAIGILYGMFGSLNIADIASNINSIGSIALFIPLALLVTGFGIEGALFPLNGWLPDAHSSAPSSVSAILSGIAIGVGIYAVARVIFTLFGVSSIFPFLAILGVLTLLVGEASAFKQNNLKRMLAYSSIGQIGLIVFGLGIATYHGISGGLFQVVSHALGKSLLFMAAGYMIYRTGSMDISALKGIGERMPLTSIAFTIGAFSLVGLPPFVGFASKFLIIQSALLKQDVLFFVLAVLVLLATVIEVAYFLRVCQIIHFKEGNNQKKEDAPLVALIPMFILVSLIIIIGIYPNLVFDFLNSAASGLLDKLAYIEGVL